jgi:NADH dehydrogenase
MMKQSDIPKIVIIGGGFGGIEVAKQLNKASVEVVLLDKHNYHTFQPLLYQVAIGAIEADAIGFPIRRIFTRQKNFSFFLTEVIKICPDENKVVTTVGEVFYDYLVIATGSDTNFFGNKTIEQFSMPMKNIPEALNLRSLIMQNLEAAHLCENHEAKMALMTFVVVGGGPTGVELAGALAEMRKLILMKDYHNLKSSEMKVYLIEGKPELLAAMSATASSKAKQYLSDKAVVIYNGVHVKSYDGLILTVDDGMIINTKNVFWAAGVKGEVPEGVPAAIINKGGRIQTDNINRLNGWSNIFAIGDAAAVTTPETPNGHPGVAPAAIQQGRHLAKNLQLIINGKQTIPFQYKDKGSLATIGRNQAVADIGKIHLHGFVAWLLWGFVHIISIAGFSNKGIVFLNWVINYVNCNSDNRLIIRVFKLEKQ